MAKPLINLHLTPNGCGIFGCEADNYYHNRKQATGGSTGGLLGAAADFLFPKKKAPHLTPGYDYYQPEQSHNSQQHQPDQHYYNQHQKLAGYPDHHFQDEYIPYPPATGPSFQSNRKEFFPHPDPTPPHTTPSRGHHSNGNVNFFDGASLSTKKIKFGDGSSSSNRGGGGTTSKIICRYLNSDNH